MAATADPSPWVRRFADLIAPGGMVLDLACGSGRHALLFAARGCRVLAVDRDREALAGLAGLPGIEPRCVDLEAGDWPFADASFDGIVVTNYLYRPLLPRLATALADGGVLIYETFMRGNEAFGSPRNPEFLLQPNELLYAFLPHLGEAQLKSDLPLAMGGESERVQEGFVKRSMSIVAFEQGEFSVPHRAVKQRLCAISGIAPYVAVPPERSP